MMKFIIQNKKYGYYSLILLKRISISFGWWRDGEIKRWGNGKIYLTLRIIKKKEDWGHRDNYLFTWSKRFGSGDIVKRKIVDVY